MKLSPPPHNLDRHDLEKLIHVVLRFRVVDSSTGFTCQWLRIVPGGDDKFEWTEHEWEKFQFPNQKEAEQYAALYGGHAAPCKLPEEPMPPQPPPPPAIRQHTRRRRPSCPPSARKWYDD